MIGEGEKGDGRSGTGANVHTTRRSDYRYKIARKYGQFIDLESIAPGLAVHEVRTTYPLDGPILFKLSPKFGLRRIIVLQEKDDKEKAGVKEETFDVMNL